MNANNPQMPQALDAECAVLAAILHDNSLFDEISAILKPEHFYDKLHAKFFEVILQLIAQGLPVNSVSLWQFFKNEKITITRGGEDYLNNISSYLLSLNNTVYYANIILDRFVRRQLLSIANDIITQSYTIEPNKSGSDILESAEQRLFDLSNQTHAQSMAEPLGILLTNAVRDSKKALVSGSNTAGVCSGFRDFDQHIGGFHNSDLVVIAARPSMGKTALSLNIAVNAAKSYARNAQQGAEVAFFSLEMSASQLAMRVLAQETGVSADSMRRGVINPDAFDKLQQATHKLSNLPLYIDDSPIGSIAEFRIKARRLKRKHNIGLIVIDYLQLLTDKFSENRVQELSFITRSLKALAKELALPIIALSQLSRAVEQRDDKRPQLSDLRESGSIEQDADIVAFIYRAAYYESRKKPPEGSPKMSEWQAYMKSIENSAEIIISKQRHGPIRNFHLYFDSNITKFSNLEKH